MSYMSPLRLHFAGKFQANVSTVNNDPGHFYNAIFQASYQEMQGPGMDDPPNGWFNPQGDAAFRLLGCTVTAAMSAEGVVPQTDPILSCIVADSDTQVPAKLVDLDPEQQLVSEIWGLVVRIADRHGCTLLEGQFEPAAFMDIWDRATGQVQSGDADAGSYYQSVLTGLRWGDVSGSPFLQALQAAASDGLLSIKFNVDSFNLSYNSPEFMCGRIVGTIGPASAAEPRHMVLGRQFLPKAGKGGNFFVPAGNINGFQAVVHEAAGARSGSILLDLGNAISTGAGGIPNNLGDLTLGVYDPIATPSNPAGTFTALGTVPAATYTASDWYAKTAGLVAIPLDATQLASIARQPLALYNAKHSNLILEPANGCYVRADRFVFRQSPGDSFDIDVRATRFGKPLAGATVALTRDSSQLQDQNASIFVAAPPAVATPAGAIEFGGAVTTDVQGRALYRVACNDPGKARWFNGGKDYGIDGQLYGLRPTLTDPEFAMPLVDQWAFVSVLLWSGYQRPEPLTWESLQPIFQQYANLYPVMARFLNLASFEQVVAASRLLKLAFSLPPTDPNTMPVTRDLSPLKRAAILAWLDNPVKGGEKTTEPTPKAVAAGAPPSAGEQIRDLASKGGKTAAAARRRAMA